VVGVSPEPIEVNAPNSIFGARSVEGSLTQRSTKKDVLSFSVLENIRPMVETIPFEKAAEAYARMMRNEARFRRVLTTGQ
jgi:alcohol dehydrogenase, propanol-preferring